MNRIEQIRAREQEATPGEWAITGAKSHLIDSKPEEKYGAVSIVCEVWNNIDTNAAFIAHARQDIPYLLSEVDRMTAELEQYRKQEAGGLLKMFPCKYGDKIYYKDNGKIMDNIVFRIIVADDCYMVEVLGGRYFFNSDYNKTWFVSLKEAEQPESYQEK